ncbi:NodT family RND efflux system outer membrane lipoprotein [Flammeovirgaceae bacterium 311]|nr:NodT family RND efflux system outer membrane lipoprotein [Flammeovirgaceae bacterium 311]
MLIKRLLYISFFILFVPAFISSCKVAEPPNLPRMQEMPQTFTGSADTSSVGDIPWNSFFQDPHLVDLIETSLANNLDLLIAVQRVEMAQAEFQLRRGALLPSVQGRVTANIGNLNNRMVGNTVPDRTIQNLNQNYFVGFQSAWEADVWGRLRNMRKAAYLRYLASHKGRQLVRTSLIAEVSRLYYELLTLDNELQIVQKNIELQETAVEVIKIQKMAGRATELAVQQFTAQWLGTRALESEIRQNITETENNLNLLLGRYTGQLPRGASILEQPMPEDIRAGVPSGMLLRRPDIREAELELTAAKADIEAARAAFLPSFIISPYAGLNAGSAGLLFQTPESIAIGALASMVAPIFNRRQIRADYSRTVAQGMESVYNYQQTILEGYQEVLTDLARIRNYRDMYELKEQEVAVLQSAVSTANDLYTTGYASYLEVITAQRRVLEAELELANTRKEIFLSVIELYRALGGGWKEDNL